MRWMRDVRRRVRRLFRLHDEREMDEEIAFHLEKEIEEHVRHGVSPKEARRRALAAFGRVEDVKDRVRDVRPVARLLGDLRRDGRVALRSLPRQPVFGLAVLLTLGIGIGGNVAMFGVLDVVLYRSLPYPDSERLVLGRVTYDGRVGNTVSGPDFFDYRDRNRSLDALAAITPFRVESTVTGTTTPERVSAPLVSVGFFETLGVPPLLGRGFRPNEEEPNGPPVTVLSHAFWQRSFGADPGIVGSAIRLDGTPTTVVGVMPPGFRFLVDAELWRPIQRGGTFASARQFHNFVLVGRLAPGVPLERGQEDVDLISAELADAFPDTNEDKGLNLTPLREALSEDVQGRLRLLVAAILLILVVACANVGGLLVVRGNARRTEIAVRSVMGAGRGRLARQLLTENGLLAFGATGLGVLLAVWIQRGILAFLPLGPLGPRSAGLSPAMVAAAFVLAVLTLGLFGVLPALRIASSSEPASDLRGGRRTTSSRRAGRLQNSLVVVQVALTAVLVIVAGLLIRSYRQLEEVDPGFDPADLLTAEVALPSDPYSGASARARFFEQLSERIAAVPGVESVGLVSRLPVRDGGDNVRAAPSEEWGSGSDLEQWTYQRTALPGYFEAMRIPLLAGRDVARTDGPETPAVVVVSRSLAEAMFPDGDALGRTLAFDVGGDDPGTAQIVGVVGDVVPYSLAAGTFHVMYYPYRQWAPSTMRLAIRGGGSPARTTAAVRDNLASVDPDVPLTGVATMEEVLSDSISGRRSMMTMLLAFAGVALLLAAVGLYGLMAYNVSRRVHEIGVRIALGASSGDVTRGILGRGLALVAAGLAVALPLSLFVGRFVEDMLYRIGGLDPITWLGSAAFLAGVAALACLLPARRAAAIDPMEAFRAE